MLWHKILSLQPKNDRPMIELDEQQVVNSMLAGIPLKFPDYRAVLLFVAAYLVCLWFLLKKIKAPGKGRRQTSAYLIVMITVFTAIGYWGFYLPNLQQKFSYNSFYHVDAADPDSPAAAKYFIGLYSLKNIDYELNFGSGTAAVRHIVSEKSDPNISTPHILQNMADGQQIIGSIQRWSHNFYQLNLPMSSPLAGYARRDKSFLTLMIENKLPRSLLDCLIYYRKRFLLIEDIRAGSRQTIKVNLAKLKQKEIFGEHQIDSIVRRFHGNGPDAYLQIAQRNLTPGLLLEIHKKFQSKSGRLILIGWMPAGLLQPQFNPARPPGVGITMINWGLRVEATL